MESKSLEKLSNYFRFKLSCLTEAMTIEACLECDDDDEQNELLKLLSSLWLDAEELSSVLSAIRERCAEQWKVLDSVQGIRDNIKKLLIESKYADSNIPSHLPSMLSSNQCSSSSMLPNIEDTIDAASKLANQKEVGKSDSIPTMNVAKSLSKPRPEIEYLTIQEFEHVPKYMKGRLAYQHVNNLIEEINKVFKAKYALMRRKKSSMSVSDRKQYLSMKNQEMPNTKDCDCDPIVR